MKLKTTYFMFYVDYFLASLLMCDLFMRNLTHDLLAMGFILRGAMQAIITMDISNEAIIMRKAVK